MGRKAAPEWFSAMGDALETFGRSLGPEVVWALERDADSLWFEVKAPTKAHRDLTIGATTDEIDYWFGKLWSEFLEPSQAVVDDLLAHCDAVRDGRVREARDRRTGLVYHVYRLRSRGQHRFSRDSDYSLWHWLKPRIRRVSIHRLPPLGAAAG